MPATVSNKIGRRDIGRVKLEDEAFDFRVLMAEIERLSEGIAWIDLSFVERDRTPRWAIEVGIRCHLAGMSLREVSKHLERFGIDRSHVAVHNWVHKADLQPISTVSEDQLAVDEKMIRLHGRNSGCTVRLIHRRTKSST